MMDRFKSLLDQLHLSPSEFADRIGVQRSSISHILSGRNKPSIDFLEKILNAFPDTDVKWLITGRATPNESVNILWKETNEAPIASDWARDSQASEKISPDLDNPEIVDQIIFVYKNNTFRLFNPSERSIIKNVQVH